MGACARSGQRPGEDCRSQRLQVCLAGQLRIDLTEPLGGPEQQCCGVAATRGEKRNLAAEQTGLRLFGLTETPCFSRCDQPQSVIQRSGLHLRLGRGERPPRPL